MSGVGGFKESLVPFLGREMVKGRVSRSTTMKENQYHVAFANHSFMMLMAFLSYVWPPRELQIRDLSGHHAHMWAQSCGGILNSFPQHVFEFDHGIKIQKLMARTRFNPVLALLAIWRAEELNWAAQGCLVWYHYGN